ncbi:unnamed protein product [Urochloa humidicola]
MLGDSPSVAAAPRQGAVLCCVMFDGDLAAQLLVPMLMRGRKDSEEEGHGGRVPQLSLSSSSSASISVEEEDDERGRGSKGGRWRRALGGDVDFIYFTNRLKK